MIMDAARHEWNLDAKRMYLFGISAGGYTVFDVSMFDSRVFHCQWRFCRRDHSGLRLEQKATRKIPLAIYIGDRDQFFTVRQAQSTRELLPANGFPVSLTIFPNLDHNYGAIANTVNADVWTFFSQAPQP
jgi:dienelactone hydrolase